VIEISSGGADHLVLRAHLPHWEDLIHVVQRARRIFNLEADPAAASAHLGDDPVLGSLVGARPGLRMPGTWDPYEVGVRAIIGQQVSVAGAGTVTARLVERHGPQVGGLGPIGLTRLFPPPSTLATADLSGLGLPGARAAAIGRFAGAVADGTLLFDRSQSLDDLVASIAALPGLGPWTAHYIALRLGEPDAFPVSDLGLRRAFERLTSNGQQPTLTEWSERWRPWRAHAAIHLWLLGGSEPSPPPTYGSGLRRGAAPAVW
jgi:AraC family transcriptional regulator of adaptative response / DNA-3-methyladenine glycosylase II